MGLLRLGGRLLRRGGWGLMRTDGVLVVLVEGGGWGSGGHGGGIGARDGGLW